MTHDTYKIINTAEEENQFLNDLVRLARGSARSYNGDIAELGIHRAYPMILEAIRSGKLPKAKAEISIVPEKINNHYQHLLKN